MLQDAGAGSCDANTPVVSESDALAVLLLNIFLPGVGAMLAAYRAREGFNYGCCGCGIGQMLLAVVLVGSIWAIIHGVQIYTKSNDYWATQNGSSAASASAQAQPAS